MISVQTEIFRGYGKLGNLSAQTAVECRFGGEVESVLAAHASVVLTGAEVENGEVRYAGRVHFIIVYEDAEKHVCRSEKGVEFSARVQDERCYPALTVRAFLNVENVSARREGASVYVTALLGGEIVLYGEQTFEYLTGGDLVLRRESVPVLTAHLCGGSAEADDEFETEFIGDILLHSETVYLSEVSCETGVLRVEGEINLGMLALKGENALVSFERLVPFNLEIPCDAASVGCNASARVFVTGVSLHADSDEEKGRCRIVAELTLQIEGCVFEETAIDAVTDAFSTTSAVALSFGETEYTGTGAVFRTTERISGKAALSSPVDFSDVLQAVVLQRAEANLVSSAEGKRAEGVASATLLVLGADGVRRGVEMSLPFSIPVNFEGECEISLMPCGMSARQKQEGEIDAEATLKITLTGIRRISARQVVSVEEGAPIRESDCAVSVYVPRAGDGLWELSKSLKKPPEEVSASNPDIEFPIKEGQRVVIYRKKSLNI